MATITEETEQPEQAEFEQPEQQPDSGMGSSDARSPEVKSLLPEEDDDDEEDETIVERLVGLTEMFPASVRNFSYNSAVCLKKCAKAFYSVSCTTTWVIFSSSAILFAPLIFEIERAQMEEVQRNQQKQVLLGPTSTMSGGGGGAPGGFAMPPPIQR